jgi:hypothetical protein
MQGYLKSIWRWLGLPQANLLIGLVAGTLFAVVLAHEISWPWLVLAAVVLIFVPPAIGSGWVSQYPSRWSKEAFVGAVTTAVLAFALIRVDVAWVRALLALAMAYVAYLAGRYSK